MLMRAWHAARRAKGRQFMQTSRSLSSLPDNIKQRVHVDPMASTYDPQAVENGWQAFWETQLVNAKHKNANAPRFTMLLPPPNITGALHIGHALTVTIQDALARYHRMTGHEVLWIPGLDHAGIATQSVVEKQLWKEQKLTRHDVGRTAFLDHVHAWNATYGSRILNQLERLGALLNKDHTFFTLDEKRSTAVVDAFCRLHAKGLVYRHRRMVNWCPTLQTAISDIEVDTVPLTKRTLLPIPGHAKPVEFGVMHRFKYKVDGATAEFVEVDTTRPETILGDVALAIHPDDPRYFHLHGKHVVHPFTNERLPIVLDGVLVDPALGTGVVKITPAHDANDWACAQRHNLPHVVVMDKQAKMVTPHVPDFHGLDRFDARAAMVAKLHELELYVEKLDHPTSVSLCSRSGNVVEPTLLPQWFVNCTNMAAASAKAVRNSSMALEPVQQQRTWFHFLDNVQDWCVSRQLWWGHRIPAYRVHWHGSDDGGDDALTNERWVVARDEVEARRLAIEKFGDQPAMTLKQDEDVLDTWFSAALLPLSALEWPTDDNVPEAIQSMYPLNVMETGADILFFWVARMSMLCHELSGRQPFDKVWLHPMVRDKSGRKMSKSLGNVIDPLHVIAGIDLPTLLHDLQQGNLDPKELVRAEKDLKKEFPSGIPRCGTDALRLTLSLYLAQGRQINMDLQRVVASRHFCNKMWNAFRYALPLLPPSAGDAPTLDVHRPHMGLADRWILSRMADAVAKSHDGFQSFRLAASATAAQRFFLQDLCDVYIEFSKPVLYTATADDADGGASNERRESAQATLRHCLDTSVRLLHPFMPFVTEELWQRLTAADGRAESLAMASFPSKEDAAAWRDLDAEESMQAVLDVMHAMRSLKHTRKTLVPDHDDNGPDDSNLTIQCTDVALTALLQRNMADVRSQCRTGVHLVATAPSDGAYLSQSISTSCQVWMPLRATANTSERVEAELARLSKRLAKAEKTQAGLHAKVTDALYTTRVPDEIQAQDAERIEAAVVEIASLTESIATLHALRSQLTATTPQ
ncbi:valine-tRNA ligase [Aphanomyces invadans]|uniref:valine--tRNA ligase n=1 Tax=Aphanomyces invadans TaxID=157072 RepID=A0A024UNI8_9STRA|nr:valine-tRNA ligase [Aphanomyces invadans]ETW07864.1 valine-tRNA ligase [Aphanomyces invadans]|eukprot:XP_008863957.1 valine-tRNA ligase [Aphanomyces invadans]